jgi:hypothetical protein
VNNSAEVIETSEVSALLPSSAGKGHDKIENDEAHSSSPKSSQEGLVTSFRTILGSEPLDQLSVETFQTQPLPKRLPALKKREEL